MSVSTSSIFNGTSRFSTDFQSVITRAVNIASLPITQMSQEKQKLQAQSDALNSLQSTFSNLSGTLASLGSSTTQNAVTAVSGDYTIARPTSPSAGQVGNYTLNITNMGTYSSALSSGSLTAITDPTTAGLTTASSLTLSVGGVNTTITPASTSLKDLVIAINGANAGVSATIVNLGGSGSANYRLSLESTSLGPVTIGLSDGTTTNLLDAGNTGTLGSFTVNGLPSGGIPTSSRTVEIAPNLSVDLVAVGSTTISVTTSPGALKTSLQTFIAQFNSAVDVLDQQRGQSGGALVGDSTVGTLSSALRLMANYSFKGTSLTDLGVTFDKTGHLQLDSTVVSGMSDADMIKAAAFLGTATTTNSFLKFATDTLKGLADPASGAIENSISTLATSITDEQTRIDTTQLRVNDLQTRLQARMAHADALIANLEQQVSYYTSLFQAYLDSTNTSGK